MTDAAEATRAQTSAPIATTKAGKVRGAVDNGINVFKGVRYGADTSTTRFAAPKAPAPWSDVKDALAFGASAPQPAGGTGGGGLFASWAPQPAPAIDEDCLFLNVWAQGLADGKKRPVMVWLHGGGFAAGNGSSNAYNGTRLALRGDVVVITINHRLNIFGHLHLADVGGAEFADSGNAGILDIILALKWVRDNAAAFGGDAGNVTIFGESGGGAKVTVLMAMPAAKGLFHRAVVQSGAWLKVNTAAEATVTTKGVLEQLNLAPGKIDAIKTLPVSDIQKAYAAAMRAARSIPSPDAPGQLGPVIDSKNLLRHPFTPDAPPESKDVPFLIGANRTESTLLVGMMDPSLFDLTWEALPEKLTRMLPKLDIAGIVARYRKLHPDFTPSDVFFAVTTDSRFLRGHVAEAQRQAALGGAPVFMYDLAWKTPVNGGKWRSPHALEIGFVFDNVAYSESMSGIGPDQQRIADLMSEAWIAFAKTGNPQTSALPAWPAYDAKTRQTMVFDLAPEVVGDLRGEEMRLFAALPMGTIG